MYGSALVSSLNCPIWAFVAMPNALVVLITSSSEFSNGLNKLANPDFVKSLSLHFIIVSLMTVTCLYLGTSPKIITLIAICVDFIRWCGLSDKKAETKLIRHILDSFKFI